MRPFSDSSLTAGNAEFYIAYGLAFGVFAFRVDTDHPSRTGKMTGVEIMLGIG